MPELKVRRVAPRDVRTHVRQHRDGREPGCDLCAARAGHRYARRLDLEEVLARVEATTSATSSDEIEAEDAALFPEWLR